MLLLLLCAAVLRAYRRRLTERDRAALALSRHEATTDALTGLGNRRRLLAELETVLSVPAGPCPPRLLLFDLDGFKTYNDTFGHPAGDALLQRLADKLRDAVGAGAAYRLGGDEFCVLTGPGDDPDAATAAAAQALTEHGEGFRIGSSWVRSLLHHEASDATTAMQLADRRMYARKNGGRPSAGRQTRDVLLATLMEAHRHVRSRTPRRRLTARGCGSRRLRSVGLVVAAGRLAGLPASTPSGRFRGPTAQALGSLATP